MRTVDCWEITTDVATELVVKDIIRSLPRSLFCCFMLALSYLLRSSLCIIYSIVCLMWSGWLSRLLHRQCVRADFHGCLAQNRSAM